MNLAQSIAMNRKNSIVLLMGTMGERLQAALDARRCTAVELIHALKMAKGTVYNILNDTTRPEKVWADTSKRICKYLRISDDWLVHGVGDMDAAQPTETNEPDWDNILGYAHAVGLGDGPDADEYAETHKLKFRSDSLRRKRLRPQSLAVMYGKGDSMLPRIRTGDAILFDTSDTRPQDETLFVIMCRGIAGDGFSVKRCRQFGEHWFFEALNPEGDHQWRRPRQMDDAKTPCEIIGRVRWIGSWED